MPKLYLHGPMTWKVMRRNAWTDIANLRIKRHNNHTKSWRHAWMTTNLKKKKLDQLENCPRFTNCSEMSRSGSYWETWYLMVCEQPCSCGHKNGQKLVTNAWRVWPQTFIVQVNANNIVMCENTAQQCRLGLFQDSAFARDFEDSTSTSGDSVHFRKSKICAIMSDVQETNLSFTQFYGSWSNLSLDAALRIAALDLWDLVFEVFHSSPNQTNKTKDVREPWGNLLANTQPNMRKTNSNHAHQSQFDQYRSRSIKRNKFWSQCNVFEDNEAVIKMTTKGRSPTMRHVSRTHRVALDWLFDGINLDSKIQIRYIDTKHQLADILTKGNFTRDEWNNFLHLFNISHFSSTCCAVHSSLVSCPKTMAKRMQEQKGEERIVTKSKSTAVNLFSHVPACFSHTNPIRSRVHTPRVPSGSAVLGKHLPRIRCRRRQRAAVDIEDADTVDGEVATERTVHVPKLGLPQELAYGPSSRLLEVDPVCHRLVLGVFLNHQNHSVNFHLLYGWYSSTLQGRRLRRGTLWSTYVVFPRDSTYGSARSTRSGVENIKIAVAPRTGNLFALLCFRRHRQSVRLSGWSW